MHKRNRFATWGISSLVSMGFSLTALILIPLVEREVITVSGFSIRDLKKYVVLIGISLFVIGVILGHIALYFGRQLRCDLCDGDFLLKDRFGFQGLNIQAVTNVANGKCICPHCSVTGLV